MHSAPEASLYPHLLSPLRVGPAELRNRVVMGAHFTMFTEPNPVVGEPGFYGRRLGRYLADRAQGGVAAVIAGQTAVHPTTAYQMPNNAQAWSEDAVPHFEALTAQVHEHGALAFIQLTHNGGVNQGPWSKLPAWAPSDVANYHEPPKPLELAEIRELVEHFARCARHATQGGFDGIEVQGAHGYLIHEFLSPKSNLRTDAYGGSFENRLRFGAEVLESVREATGGRLAVGLRLVGDEEQHDRSGLTADDAGDIAAAYEAMGLVDFLNVSVGVSGIGMVRTNYATPGLGVYAAAAVKKKAERTPVFTVHRILTPEQAEAIVAGGEADGITLVRALIADPEWVRKAAEGRPETIRLCTGSNQSCYGNLLLGLPINCVQNPAVGREADLGLGTMTPAANPKRVVVVGGGPAGLEAAWVAAQRGHRVTLLERANDLGGKIRLAQALPGREELADFADWRAGECERQGVDVRLGVEATADAVLALEPDAVVLGTGGVATKLGRAKWHPMPVPGSDQDWVLDHEGALRRALVGDDGLGNRIVVLDAVGHIEAVGLGELLASQGREVTVVTALPSPIALDGETQAAALPRAVRAGMRWRPNTVLAAIGDHEVTLVDTLAGTFEAVADVDTVVIRTHGVPDRTLYEALTGRVPELRRVGDAVAVRTCDRAIFDGHVAGRAL
jgi:2,4-dienoyl-CoA reductase-like NADH-dependent reductase (Old Yellow Enzyme family)